MVCEPNDHVRFSEDISIYAIMAIITPHELCDEVKGFACVCLVNTVLFIAGVEEIARQLFTRYLYI